MKEALLGCLLSLSKQGLLDKREGVAIVDGNHHGDIVFGWNSFSRPHRCMYHRGSTTEKLCMFQTEQNKNFDFILSVMTKVAMPQNTHNTICNNVVMLCGAELMLGICAESFGNATCCN